jgi:hypothetical protein
MIAQAIDKGRSPVQGTLDGDIGGGRRSQRERLCRCASQLRHVAQLPTVSANKSAFYTGCTPSKKRQQIQRYRSLTRGEGIEESA